MKKILGYDKLRGGYYTPMPIADFIVQWAIRRTDDNILETSCGDGSFIRSIVANGGSPKNTIGVELDPVEAEKTRTHGSAVVNEDFLTFYSKEIQNKCFFDVVLGNPPFVRSQNFDEQYRQKPSS